MEGSEQEVLALHVGGQVGGRRDKQKMDRQADTPCSERKRHPPS